MTRSQRAPLFAALALLFGACASVPSGPSLMALPGRGKSFSDFQRDDQTCRGWAAQQIGAGRSAQRRYDMAYTQCMYANGEQVPVARATSSNYAPPPPRPPTGSPPPPPASGLYRSPPPGVG